MQEALQRKMTEIENYFNIIALADKKIDELLIGQAKSLLVKTPKKIRGPRMGVC